MLNCQFLAGMVLSDWMLRCGRFSEEFMQMSVSLRGRGLRRNTDTCTGKQEVKRLTWCL